MSVGKIPFNKINSTAAGAKSAQTPRKLVFFSPSTVLATN
jgi:hypothetical protein